LWVVLDPISTVPIFLVLTAGATAAQRRVLATKAVLVAAFLLLAFIVGGQLLLDALEIPIYSFQLAGGILLFLYALKLFFAEGLPTANSNEETGEPNQSIVVFPLGVPVIAGPGAMLAVVLLTDNDRYSIHEQLDTVIVLVVVLVVLWLIMMAAETIKRLIGDVGANVLSRIMGLILAAVAAENVLRAAAVYVKTIEWGVAG
jgi:multiple antibiotic resistance protein